MSAVEQVTEELFGKYNFLLEVESMDDDDRKIVAGFTGISGGGVKIEKRDVTHGDDPHRMHMPGAIEYENIKLTRGATINTDLVDWIQRIVDGEVDRRSGSIILLDNAGDEVKRYDFYGGWPCAFSGVDLDSSNSSVAIESFELAVTRTEWNK